MGVSMWLWDHLPPRVCGDVLYGQCCMIVFSIQLKT